MTQSQGYLDFFLENEKLPTLFSDNMSALALSKSNVVTRKSKHLDLRLHTIKDHAENLAYVPSSLNKAGPLTKPLSSGKYLGIFHADGEFGETAKGFYFDFGA